MTLDERRVISEDVSSGKFVKYTGPRRTKQPVLGPTVLPFPTVGLGGDSANHEPVGTCRLDFLVPNIVRT